MRISAPRNHAEAGRSPAPKCVASNIDDYLTRYAATLTDRDAEAAAALWTTPGMIADDRFSGVLESSDKMVEGLKQSYLLYQKLGLDSVGYELVDENHLTGSLVLVRVRWKFFDAERQLLTDSNAYYLLRAEDTGLYATLCIQRMTPKSSMPSPPRAASTTANYRGFQGFLRHFEREPTRPLRRDVEETGPGKTADGWSVWVRIRERDTRIAGNIAPDVEREPDHIGHYDFVCESVGHGGDRTLGGHAGLPGLESSRPKASKNPS